jgi:hypothetical protein
MLKHSGKEPVSGLARVGEREEDVQMDMEIGMRRLSMTAQLGSSEDSKESIPVENH